VSNSDGAGGPDLSGPRSVVLVALVVMCVVLVLVLGSEVGLPWGL